MDFDDMTIKFHLLTFLGFLVLYTGGKFFILPAAGVGASLRLMDGVVAVGSLMYFGLVLFMRKRLL